MPTPVPLAAEKVVPPALTPSNNNRKHTAKRKVAKKMSAKKPSKYRISDKITFDFKKRRRHAVTVIAAQRVAMVRALKAVLETKMMTMLPYP